MYPLYFLYDQWPVLILRIALGAIFIVHGWPKIRDLKQNAKNFASMGFKPGALFGTITALLEFLGGIALVIGLFVSIISALYVVELFVIIAWRMIKQRAKFFGGWEFELLMFASAVALFSLGGGAFSLDRMLFGWL